MSSIQEREMSSEGVDTTCSLKPSDNGASGIPADTAGKPEEAHAGRDMESMELGTHTKSVGQTTQAADPFDPRRLRLSQDFAKGLGVKKVLTTVPVRKPAKEWFVQTHPGDSYRMDTAVVELKEERELYLVDPALWPDLATSESTFSPRALFTGITRQGVIFIWPIRLPGPDGRLDDWSRSALEAANAATSRWTRIEANMHLNAYDVSHAVADLPDPDWPETTFHELLKIAFNGRLIDSADHVVLKKLRGEL